MSPDDLHATPTLRVLHAARGHARHLPALALLEIDARQRWIELPLLPLDLVAVVVARDRQLEFDGGPGARSRRASFVGTLRRVPLACRTRGRAEVAVALLTPLGALRAFGMPLGLLHPPHTALARAAGLPSAATVHRLLARRATPAWRLAAFADWLEARMARQSLPPAALRTADAAMRLLGQGDASPRLEDLSREAGVTPRQLRRDFHHWLGLAPADYRRLVRLQRSLGRIAHGMPLADAATAHGYADQAHMTRDVVAWTGLAPSQLAGARRSPSLAALQHALGGRVLLPHWG